jgi:hypothetical protein
MMTVSANMHNVKMVQAAEEGKHAWLRLAEENDNTVIVFMPFAAAKAMADAFNAAMVELDAAS